MNLAELMTKSAEEHGDRPALKLDDSVLNYAVLNEAATRVAKVEGLSSWSASRTSARRTTSAHPVSSRHGQDRS